MTFNIRTIKTDAIILRRSEYRESDYLVTVFTPHYGKLRALVRGARKPTTRKTGQVELFTRVHLVLSGARRPEKYFASRNGRTLSTHSGRPEP